MLQINKKLELVEPQVEERTSVDVLQQALKFLRRQYAVIAVAIALTTMVGIAYLITTPPSYSAAAKMIIDTRKVQLFQQQIMADIGVDSAAVESQIEILKSQNIAQNVVSENHLAENPDFLKPGSGLWQTITAAVFGAPPPEVLSEAELTARAVAAVKGGLFVKRAGF